MKIELRLLDRADEPILRESARGCSPRCWTPRGRGSPPSRSAWRRKIPPGGSMSALAFVVRDEGDALVMLKQLQERGK